PEHPDRAEEPGGWNRAESRGRRGRSRRVAEDRQRPARPRGAHAGPRRPRGAAGSRAAGPRPRGNPARAMKVALADDQGLVRHGLRRLLESLGGIEVTIEAEDGDALLAALQRTRVDVILSDIRMPRRSGVEVTRALRDRGDFTPVLLITTFDDPGLLRAAA